MAVPPLNIKKKHDIPAMLGGMGFVVQFNGRQGLVQLMHPELLVEFLVPETGRGSDKPVALPLLGVNAQPLRFLNFLTGQIIRLDCDGLILRVPHPAHFALHKFIIFQRRKGVDKIAKDKEMASRILRSLVAKDEQLKIIDGLKKGGEQEIVELLKAKR